MAEWNKARELESLVARRGFVWPGGEIYGPVAGLYDYGPNGAVLKRNFEESWIRYFVGLSQDYHLVDTAKIVQHAALKASGHVDSFIDILVSCTSEKCGQEHRADHLYEELTKKSGEGMTAAQLGDALRSAGAKCSRCGSPLGEPREMNLMFPVDIGGKGSGGARAFLRPETAQSAYLSFKQVFKNFRQRLPLGIAIIGRAYRNEIAPRQGVFRMREFTQAELQIFMDPETFDARIEEEDDYEEVMSTDLRVVLSDQRDRGVQPTSASSLASSGRIAAIPKAYAYHLAKVQRFYLDVLRIPSGSFRLFEKNEKERAFYNRVHFDVEVAMDSLGGFKEVAGVHYRGDWDLSRHQEGSKQSHEVETDLGDGKRKKVLPHVLELSFGVDRSLWALLDAHIALRESKQDKYAFLHLPPRLSPVQVAVFPLMKKDGLAEKGREIWRSLRGEVRAFYDESGSIGKRYARADEAGTPLAVTVDYDTLTDGTVTLRDRDSTSQERIAVDALASIVRGRLSTT